MSPRLCLRPGVHISPAPDGLLVLSSTSAFVIRNAQSAHKLVDEFADLLREGVEAEDLLYAQRPDQIKNFLNKVLKTLRSHDLIIEGESLRVAEVAAKNHPQREELIRYLLEIAKNPLEAILELEKASVIPAANIEVDLAQTITDWVNKYELNANQRLAGGDSILICDSDQAPALTKSLVLRILCLGQALIILPVMKPEASLRLSQALIKRSRLWLGEFDINSVAQSIAAGFTLGQLLRYWARSKLVATVVEGQITEAKEISLKLAPFESAKVVNLANELQGKLDEVAYSDLIEAIERISQRWSGLIKIKTDLDWPQLPFSLTSAWSQELSQHAGWGENHSKARVLAVLNALRGPEKGDSQEWIKVAGTSLAHLSIDGLLSLEDPPSPKELSREDPTSLDIQRIWRSIEDYLGRPIKVTTSKSAFADAVCIEIFDRGDVTPLARQWGPTQPSALESALAETWTRLVTKIPLEKGGGYSVAFGETTVSSAKKWAQSRLVALSKQGRKVSFKPKGSDTILGDMPFMVGYIRLDRI